MNSAWVASKGEVAKGKPRVTINEVAESTRDVHASRGLILRMPLPLPSKDQQGWQANVFHKSGCDSGHDAPSHSDMMRLAIVT